MSFVSHAQNYEDVMLWRALKGVGQGFYIDVGANDPQVDSVTKAFYDRGWSGINIEPIESHCTVLNEARERDVNLQCAAGASAGELKIWNSETRGWSTMDAEVVAIHERKGHMGSWQNVPVRTLTSICEEYVSSDIHFLKIDVEGFEGDVLKGMDFETYRPWIVVVEATVPDSQVENFSGWEGALVGKAYEYVYGDGLNRFYLAKEHMELSGAFKYPPNIFDGFVTSELQDAIADATASEAQAQRSQLAEQNLVEARQLIERMSVDENRAKNELARLKLAKQTGKAELAQALSRSRMLDAQLQSLQAQFQLIQESSSWRLTAPIRWFADQVRLLLRLGARARIKALLKKIIRGSISFLNARPLLRNRLIATAKAAGLGAILKKLYWKAQGSCTDEVELRGAPRQYEQLSPHGKEIYHALEAAIDSANVKGA